VIVSVADVLNCIAKSRKGARAVVDTEVFDALPELLRSQIAEARQCALEILTTLATHTFVLKLILDLSICSSILSLLRHVRPLMLEIGADYHVGMPISMSSTMPHVR
jgi:hypothetical protein